MRIRTTCPSCKAAFEVAENLAGKKVRCSRCQGVLEVPYPDCILDEAVQAEPGLVSQPSPAGAGPGPGPKKSSAGMWIAAGCAGLALLFVGCGGALAVAFLLLKPARQPDADVVFRNPPPPRDRPDPWQPPPPDVQPPDPIGKPKDKPRRDKNPPPPKPETRLELPPLPAALEIKPAPVKEETSYKLPESASRLRVGGGGRFLILLLPTARKLAVFDVNEAKIVRYIAVPDEEVQFAAGMTKLLVYAPQAKTMTRFNLLDGAQEHSAAVDLPDGKFEGFCMGHASAGPLLVSVNAKATGIPRTNVRLLDIETFKEVEVPPRDRGRVGLEGGYYWAGATGRVLGHTGNYGQPNGVKTVLFENGKVQHHGEHAGTWFVVPGPDDRHVYAGGHGVLSERVTKLNDVAFSMPGSSGFASHLYLPAHHGPFYLHAMTIQDFGGRDKTPMGTIRLFMLGDKEPITTYASTPVCKYGWEELRGFGIEHSLHLIPQAKLLVVVPGPRNELRLYPCDLDAVLDKLDRDFLVFTSTPPRQFEKGKVFRYEAQVRAKKGPIEVKIDSGPNGMSMTPTGTIEWNVPADFAQDRLDVILRAKDGGGKEMFQTFSLTGK